MKTAYQGILTVSYTERTVVQFRALEKGIRRKWRTEIRRRAEEERILKTLVLSDQKIYTENFLCPILSIPTTRSNRTLSDFSVPSHRVTNTYC